MTHSVLFVCTANICRSPMAMGLMLAKVQGSADEWNIASAGVWADPGYPPAVNTLRVLEARGIELRAHRSRQITPEMVHAHELILVMERNHKEALRAAFPEKAGRIFLLTEMVDRRDDIVDPIGGSLADYQDTAQEIEAILAEGFENILRLAQSSEV
jgi:protein-tyrosine-phosphatase